MTPTTPLHTDRYQSPLIQLLAPLAAGVFLAWGLVRLEPALLGLGFAFGLFVLLTKHSRYLLYADRLVVRYGVPRQKTIPLFEIEAAEAVRLPMNGLSVVLHRTHGRPLVINPSHPQEFVDRLHEIMRISDHHELPAAS